MSAETGTSVACWGDPVHGAQVVLCAVRIGSSGTVVYVYQAPDRGGSLGSVSAQQAIAEMQRRIDAGMYGPHLVHRELAPC